jgi:hypothetical protein
MAAMQMLRCRCSLRLRTPSIITAFVYQMTLWKVRSTLSRQGSHQRLEGVRQHPRARHPTVFFRNTLLMYPWAPSHPGKFRSYLAILQCLSALSQELLPFHACDAVQSNDVLFAGDDE